MLILKMQLSHFYYLETQIYYYIIIIAKSQKVLKLRYHILHKLFDIV